MRATRELWKTLTPMPAARKALAIRQSFTPSELATMRDGFIPRDMDDRWFCFAEDDWLYLHRSWSGLCVYQVRLRGAAITEAWVNRDPEQYRETDDEIDSRLLSSLLMRLASGSAP